MKNKYKILVLSDTDQSVKKILKTSINLADVIDGEIDFFCVKKPINVVHTESQLSAIRTINNSFITADNKIKRIKKELYKDKEIKIQHKISFGNLKDELSKHLKETKPDIVILGKSKTKLLSFLGDNLVDFLMKEYKGTIIVTDNKKTLKTNSNLSLGFFNNVSFGENLFTERLTSLSKKPLKSFQISGDKVPLRNVAPSREIVEFIFDKGDAAAKNVSSYLTKNNIDLLFVSRNETSINMSDFLKKTNCDLLLTN